MTRVRPSPPTTRLRVLAVDDHPAVLLGLQRVLGNEPDLDPVALADERELWNVLHDERIDVVVLDYDLAHRDGLAQCLRIKQHADSPAVVIYTAHADPSLMLAARIAQADALVDKARPVQALLDAIRLAAAGARLLPDPSHAMLEGARDRLEPSELPILAMLLDNVPLREIADTLGLDERAPIQHAQRILGRLRAREPGPTI